MSGGSYDYLHSRIEQLADDLQEDLDGNFMVNGYFPDTKEMRDRLADADPQERVAVLESVAKLIDDLRSVAKRAKAFDWYISGDTGVETYLE